MPPKKDNRFQGPTMGGSTLDLQMAKNAAEISKLQDGLKDLARELKNLAKESGAFSSVWDNLFGVTDKAKSALQASKELTEDATDEEKKQAAEKMKSFQSTKEIVGLVDQQTEGLGQMVQSAQNFTKFLSAGVGPIGIMIGLFTALVSLVQAVAKEIVDTRKELGVSAVEAGKVAIQNRIIARQAKLYGLELQDIKDAQSAIRQDLGASVQESVKLSLSFARTAAATGQSASDLTKTLSIMESLSSSSREVLLNQIRSNAAMIQAAGVAPALVMKDIADNAEFFASFARDGGQNLIAAGTAARKLGLDMSAVSSITESLLDFESSIEKSMEASVLLGRQINTDRARMLALTGDQAGLMKEIQRIVGGEAEFATMNVLQRRALAESVGVSVEQLSRLVRGQTAGATGAAAGNAMGTLQEKQLSAANNTNERLDNLISVNKAGNRIMEGG